MRSLSLSLSLAFSIALSLPHPEGPLIPEMKKEFPRSSSSMGKEKEDKGAFFAEQRRPFSSSALHSFFISFYKGDDISRIIHGPDEKVRGCEGERK